jgi:streptomycin 6-kinase
MLSVHGERGAHWLHHLTQHVQLWASQWQFGIESVLPNPSFHFIAHVRLLDGTPAIFKSGPPDEGFVREFAALKHMIGPAVVKVLRGAPDKGVLLLESLQPGTSLSADWCAIRDEQSTHIAAQLMPRVWKTVESPHSFPDVLNWGRSLFEWSQQKDPLPRDLTPRMVDMAAKIYCDLANSMSIKVLLHGDLHHENILQHGEHWRVIDPKGLVGEPAFEAGAFVRNPMPQIAEESQLQKLLQRRLSIFADVWNCDYERLWGWSFSQAVLSAIWATEDEDNWQVPSLVAHQLAHLKA